MPNSAGGLTLEELLGLASKIGLQKQEQQADLAKLQALQNQKYQQQQEFAQNALQQVQDLSKKNPNMGYSLTESGASVTPKQNLLGLELRADQFKQKQANQYASKLEKYSDLSGAAQDLERITNRDGKGGIFTNPDAKLISAGKIVSAIPDSGIGIAELTGVVPKGTAEERKAFARYKLAMGHALTGARMNPTMQKAIGDSMGAMASADPNLMAKGLRGSARIVGSTINTVQGGFSPDVKEMVHDQMGGNPMDFYSNVLPEGGSKSSSSDVPDFVKKELGQ